MAQPLEAESQRMLLLKAAPQASPLRVELASRDAEVAQRAEQLELRAQPASQLRERPLQAAPLAWALQSLPESRGQAAAMVLPTGSQPRAWPLREASPTAQ